MLNSADRGGGAERLAMTVLDGFEALGTETWLAVGTKRTDHPRVVRLDASPFVDYSRDQSPRRLAALKLRRRVTRSLGLEDFEHPWSRRVLEMAGSPPDVVLCDNLHGGWFDLRALPALSRSRPLVLRLADSWPFTGHCACPLGCGRWETGCGRCPDLEIPPAIRRDVTRLNWRRKRHAFSGSRLFLAAPSRWLLERASRSLLAPAIAEARVIPGAVDLDVFNPGDRNGTGEARRLLYVSHGGADNPYKDFATIREAVARLRGPVELTVVGGAKAATERLGENRVIRHLPYVDSAPELATLYRSADVYVHAAPEESFCLTAAEALACGTPVVAAAAGGVREVVEHGHTGFVSDPGDPRALADALGRLRHEPQLRARMGAAGVAVARRRFDGERVVAELHAWCSEIAQREGARQPAAAGAKP
ncbi:MAG: glycosyltransferase [Thermoleophilaceae bacterium]